jgi:hypothetical protein
MRRCHDLPPLGPELPAHSRIAVIGSGIAGSAVAHFLCKSGRYAVTLYERDRELGGAHRSVEVGGKIVDIGVVYVNPYDYVNLFALYSYLGVETRSFLNGLTLEIGLDDAGGSLVFSTPNGYERPWLLQPEDADLEREVRALDELFADPLQRIPLEHWGGTLGAWMSAVGFSEKLRRLLALVLDPMMMSLDTPLGMIAPFYSRIQLTSTPLWWLPRAGTADVVARLLSVVEDKRRGAEVSRVERGINGVTLTVDGKHERFDYVVSSVTMCVAARIFDAPSAQEAAVFACFPAEGYVRFNTWVHEDARARCFPVTAPRLQYSTVYLPHGDPAPTSTEMPGFDDRNPTARPAPYVTDCLAAIPFSVKGPVHDKHGWEFMERSREIYNLRPTFNRMQGVNRTFWCGVDTTDMNAEAALVSGLAALHAMGVPPEEHFLGRQALAKRYLYTGWSDGDHDDPAWWQMIYRLY